MQTTLLPPKTPAHSLLEEDEFAGVVATVVRDNAHLDDAMAARIVEEALKFVAACASQRAGGMRPSSAVDKGWHALILHTHTYERLCARLGVFVHHWPDRPGSESAPADALQQKKDLHRTQALMAGAGYEPDPALWLQAADGVGSCSAGECEGGPMCCTTCGPKH